MKKQYKIQLPKGKKVVMTSVDFEDGVMTVNVELENQKDFHKAMHDEVCGVFSKINNQWKEVLKANCITREKIGEKYEPKDGDILFGNSITNNIIIYKGTNEKGAVLSYAGIVQLLGTNILRICKEPYLGFGYTKDYTRYGTEEEKLLLFDALAKEGKRWNAKTKQIEDLPRWRAGMDKPYYYISRLYNVVETKDIRFECDDYRYATNNYFKTREAAERVAKQIREFFKNSKVK